MQKKILLLTCLFFITNSSFASGAMANPTPKPKPITSSQATEKSSKTQKMGPLGCYGQTENPHYSKHVPGTINVISRTICKGHQVSVQTWIYLSGNSKKGSHVKYGWHSARNDAELSTSWPCISKHTYAILVVSFHFDEWGHSAETRNSQIVYCGNQIPALKQAVKK